MFRSLRNVFAFAVGFIGALFAGVASAAVDAAVSTAFTALQTDALALAAIVTPIVVAILAAGVGIKLIKRFGNKI